MSRRKTNVSKYSGPERRSSFDRRKGLEIAYRGNRFALPTDTGLSFNRRSGKDRRKK